MKDLRYSNDGTEIKVDGFFLYRNEHGMKAVQLFLDDFLSEKINFDDLYGSYLVEIRFPNNKKIFFSDNSGMRRFFINYYDIRFERTFLAALPTENRLPNYGAIAQFLHFGCVYSCDTIESHVKMSNPNSYYVVYDRHIEEKDKALMPFDEIEHDEDILANVMPKVTKAIDDYKNCFCTITGGCDSRSILAHLMYNGVKPKLDIAGQPDHIDVFIAKEIADKINGNLLVVDDNIQDGWLDEAIRAASFGMSGVCDIYRLYKKAVALGKIGDVIEFGGLAGELYKNSFINHEFPFYGGKTNWEKFIRYKVMTFDFPQNICGNTIKENIKKMKDDLECTFKQYEMSNKANSYLNAGYMILQQRSVGVSAMNNNYYTLYSPLLERRVAAYGFKKTPYDLEMQLFQRKQVSDYYPALKNIKTDRGLSCDKEKCGIEWIKSTLYMLNVWRKRFIGRKEMGRIDKCMTTGLHSKQFAKAIERCQELGILSKEIKKEDISPTIADRAFLVGTIL